MLDVKRMRILKEVADHGSFSAAAEALSYTQSAVSQQIAALEREAGTQLVTRGSRGIRLTEAGEALVRHANAILTRLADAEAELEAIAGLRGGRLRLAAFPTVGATLMPLAIATFRESHPGIQGLVAAGVGVAMIPTLALTAVRDDIVIRSLGSEAPVRTIAAATLPGAQRSPAARAMLDVLGEVAKQYAEPGPRLAAVAS